MSSFILDQVSKIAKHLQKQDNLSVEDILKIDLYEYYRELNQRAWDILSGNPTSPSLCKYIFTWCIRTIPSDRKESIVSWINEADARKNLMITLESLFDVPASSVEILQVFKL
jgi:hypothetical protein